MVNSADFAKRLVKILEYYSLTATAFAEEIDFNRSTISHLLSGRNKPSLEFVMKLLEKFPEVKLNWLMNGKGSFPSTEDVKESFSSEKEKKTQPSPPTDLFSENPPQKQNVVSEGSENSIKIDRIVIFYMDGSFKAYEN